jgi:hypothetical protein
VVKPPKLEKLAFIVMNIPVSACGGNSLIIQAPIKNTQLENILVAKEVANIIQGVIGKTISR